MSDIVVTRWMPIAQEVVWAALADLASHTAWMRDARSLEFIGEQRSGVGTRMEVETVVGPFRTLDEMEVVGWDEGRSIEVVHVGIVKGRGTLEASPDDGGTRVSWAETIRFPWWLGGPITSWLARPVLRRVWLGNLERLEGTLSSP